ncbi:hypothetical protein DPMN_051108 [Dreissena polymorpha]|uniref:Uncharacterized protein n=1 Tax=Dreissena polymorpha TaxID=45954 RepID=A0A9D4HMZ7_DREPO|nr:hypothetical protein DPMN_051108 [Dreissena polymorpha]
MLSPRANVQAGYIFDLGLNIIKTNILSKFYDNWNKNVTSRVLTMKYYKKNVTTEFHEYSTKNVTFRVYTRKTAPPSSGLFQKDETICNDNWTSNVTSTAKTSRHTGTRFLNETKPFSNFNWTTNVNSRVFTRFQRNHITKTASSNWRSCYSKNRYHFKSHSRCH